MTAYEAMIKTSHHLIKGGDLNDAQKAKIVRYLLAEKGKRKYFGQRMEARAAYPIFFAPPYGKNKLQTVVPASPKTHIFADNAYEFEILRLLQLFSDDFAANGTYPELIDQIDLSRMFDMTAARLKQTCFGYQSCHYAECFEAGLSVLRFVSFAVPEDVNWLDKQLTMYNKHFADHKRHSGVQRYFWFILSQMPYEHAEPQILRQRDTIIEQLNRSFLNRDGGCEIPIYVMRNTLARLPEFEYIKNRQPFTDAKSGRLRFF
ncbi:MAG: hypothetical protein FWE90_01330 [Defluviitaleaceae bacterium]|nr:hypothetical protein [Defluviitaleaceae bacterium]